MIDTGPVEPLDRARHRVGSFDCGVPALDRWLHAYAGQAQRRDAARTFVTTHSSTREVIGYYTLVVTEVEHETATSAVRAGMSRHFPIPACLVARLAVTLKLQRRGIGSNLLLDALGRIERASGEVGIRAVLVHAISDEAAAFYRSYGFAPATADARTLMVPLAAVRATLSES